MEYVTVNSTLFFKPNEECTNEPNRRLNLFYVASYFPSDKRYIALIMNDNHTFMLGYETEEARNKDLQRIDNLVDVDLHIK